MTFLSFVVVASSFSIEAYDISIKANKDGSLHIREELDVLFTEKSHGIYRDIQYKFENPDGNIFDPVVATISGVNATLLYKSEKEDGIMRLTLGDPKKYASDREHYTIEYDYALDWDRTDGYDELYYNIVSPSWDTTISNITWSVELPFSIDRERVWVTEGKKGGTRSASFSLNSTSTVVNGEKELLLPLSAITLRVEMDEGYWKDWSKPQDKSKPFMTASLIVSILFALLSVIFWLIYGRDNKIGPLTPGEEEVNMNPMEAGYIIDSTLSMEKEGLSMLFYWAEKGYVTIKEKNGEGDAKEFIFTKTRELKPYRPKSEKLLFSSVFFKDEVSMKELMEHGFASDFQSKVFPAFMKEARAYKTKSSSIVLTLFSILGLVLSIAVGVLLSLRHPGLLSVLTVFSLFIPFVSILIVTSLWAEGGNVWKRKTKTIAIVFSVFIILFGVFCLIGLSIEAKLDNPFSAIAMVLSLLFLATGAIFTALMGKRSKEGEEKLKRALSYREYLSTLLDGTLPPTPQDKERWGLHMAYAHAMGLKGEKDIQLDLPYPSWYIGNGWNGNMMFYWLLFSSCRASYTYSSTHYAPTAPGGGGFSSSGFSGGGFSGGGGGRW